MPYKLDVVAHPYKGGTLRLEFQNRGECGACFQVRSERSSEGPWSFTVERGKSLSHLWPLGQAQGSYDLSVSGPNGFMRRFRGQAAPGAAVLEVEMRLDVRNYALVVRLKNRLREPRHVFIETAYGGHTLHEALKPHGALERRISLKPSFGWYDVTVRIDEDENFLRHAAGHLENGEHSMSDPAFGAA